MNARTKILTLFILVFFLIPFRASANRYIRAISCGNEINVYAVVKIPKPAVREPLKFIAILSGGKESPLVFDVEVNSTDTSSDVTVDNPTIKIKANYQNGNFELPAVIAKNYGVPAQGLCLRIHPPVGSGISVGNK